MAASTWTWLGNSDIVNSATNWSLISGPGNSKERPQSGDTAIFSGAGTAPQFIDQQLSGGNTFDLTGSGTVQFLNDQSGFSNVSTIDSSVTINAEGTATSILTEGTFTNGGTVEVTGAGNSLTIDITSDVTTSGTQTGWFENDGSIFVDQGDSLTISGAVGATFAGFGTVVVDGGSALVNAALPNFSNDANFAISQGGSLEIENSGTSAQPNITFDGSGIVQIDQPGSFAGTIGQFKLGDTIDLVGVQNVASVVYDGQGDVAMLASNGDTLFFTQTNGGNLGNNNSGTFAISGTGGLTGGVAGDIVVTEGGGNTTITATPPRTWLWTPGVSASAESNNWTVVAGPPGTGGPNQGDNAINADGTVVADGNISLNSNTIELGGTSGVAAFMLTNTVISVPGGNNNGNNGNNGGNNGGGNNGGNNNGGNSPPSFQNPSIDNNSEITSDVQSVGSFVGNTTAERSLLGSAGYFVNEGTIAADGPTGSSFTLAITGTTVNGTLLPGYFINYSQIEVAAGNSMTITVDGSSELYNAGEIVVSGGSLLFDAAAGAIDGGYAGGLGSVLIEDGGTVETDASYPSNSNSTSGIYGFADGTAGNTLKIDNLGSFGGVILGFAQNDTIDLGGSLSISSVNTVVFSNTTGILNLENNSGTIVASLLIGSGHYQTGTFATTLSAGDEIADGFTFSTGADLDTLLTTSVTNDVFNNTSGSWQASGLWSNGVPGTLSTPIIGAGASGPFTLTTGASPLSSGTPILESGLLQITSATTFGPTVMRQFGGTLEVTSGNALTMPELSMFGGSATIDPTGTLDLTGHNVDGTTGAVNGTIAATNTNTRAVILGSGDLLVNGGVLDAAPVSGGQHGGDFLIGYEGGGTPATATVQNNGANAGVVTDSYTEVSSDPTSFGVLTLNGGGVSGGAAWTDEIDTSEPTIQTTGFIEVGIDTGATLTGTVAPPPFTSDATLQVENGATLTNQSYAIIGQSEGSGGSADVSGALWNIGTGPDGGFLNVGNSATSTGTLEVDSGGTVEIGLGGTFFNQSTTFTGSGFNIGNHASSAGTVIVQDGGLITDGAGVQVGNAGTGTVEILDGGTIQLTGTSGFDVATTAGASGTLIVSGESNTPSLLSASNGVNIGFSGQGVAQLINGGTISVTGTNSVNVGLSAGGSGTLQVGGAGGSNALLTTGTSTHNLNVGGGGTGTVDVESNGSIQMNGTGAINVGQSVSTTGLLIVTGPNATITAGKSTTGLNIAQGATSAGTVQVENGGTIVLNGTASGSGINIGQSTGAQGTLDIESGGSIQDNSPGNINIGQSSGATGLLIVNGSNARFNANGAAAGLAVGGSGTGTVEIENGGTLAFNSTNGGLRVGNGAGGLVEVSGGGSSLSFTTPNNPNDVGNGNSGTLEVSLGASATFNNSLQIGAVSTLSSGSVSVSGAGSALTVTGSNGQINVGAPGTGSLSISAGGSVSATASVFIATNTSASHGTITVAGGTLTDGGQLSVGNSGTGTLNIQTGGLVQLTGINGVNVGFNSGASGDVSIDGGTLSDANGSFAIANTGATGTLTIGAGGSLLAQSLSENTGGTISVTGAGAQLTTNNGLSVGGGAAGGASMTIGASGSVFASGNGNASNMSIGSGVAGDTGTVTVNTGGQLTADGMVVGAGGSGLLTVNAGALVTNTNTSGIGLGGFGVGGSGSVVVNGGTLTDDGGFTIGNTNASGTLLVEHGGLLTSGSGGFAFAGGIDATGIGTGAATVSSATWEANGQFSVGGGNDSLDINSFGLVNTGTNNVNIGGGTVGGGTISLESGGSLSAGFIGIDNSPSFGATGLLSVGGGTVTASGLSEGQGGTVAVSGGSLSVGGNVTIGQGGTGSAIMTVSDGTVSTGSLNIAQTGSSAGSVTVSGGAVTTNSLGESAGGAITVSGGAISVSGGATIGQAGSGASLTQTGGNFSAGSLVLGQNSGSSGGVFVSGGTLSASGQLTVGGDGVGSLAIANQATVLSGGNSAAPSQGIDIGQAATGSGAITVSGSKSLLNNAGAFIVGDSGQGGLSIEAGATVIATPGTAAGQPGLVIANTTGASGSSVNVSGAGSDLAVTGLLDVGASGSGALSISNGASVTAGSLDAGSIESAVANVSVIDATFAVSGNATVADDGTGVLSVLGGATFSAASLTIGSQGASSGAVVVSGAGSVINLSGELNVGTALGTGDLTIGPGAVVNAKVVNLDGQVVLANGELDPTVNLINQGETVSGSGTIEAGDIVDEGVIQASGSQPSQKLLVVSGTVVGGGPWTIDGTAQARANGGAGVLQINAGDTLELKGAVLNAGSVTFTDNLTQQSTYTVTNSVVDVNFEDATGVLKLDQIAGFAGTIVAYQAGDAFVIAGGTLSGLGVTNGTTLTVSDSGNGGTDKLIFASSVNSGGFSIVNGNTIQVACFAAGTRIGTPEGPVKVEALSVGDRVITVDGLMKPIVWIGQREVNCARHPVPETVWPVRVRAGAFGDNVPVRDLYLSPDHAVLVSGVLVPVKLLINRTSIAQVKPSKVTYYHVELERHEVILAEGLTVESYLDLGDRANFHQVGDPIRLFPDFTPRLTPDAAAAWETRGAAPLVMAGDALAAAQKMVVPAPGRRLPSVSGAVRRSASLR